MASRTLAGATTEEGCPLASARYVTLHTEGGTPRRGFSHPSAVRPGPAPSGHDRPEGRTPRAFNSWAMAASVALPARRISAITARVVALALVARRAACAG
jgi:hypothetical protein